MTARGDGTVTARGHGTVPARGHGTVPARGHGTRRRVRRAAASRRSDGFTRVELVLVIALLGVVGTLGAGFIAQAAQMYRVGIARAELMDEASDVMRRLAREVAGALPNSVRSTVAADGTYLELVPTLAAGRYRAEASVSAEPAGTDPLEFGASPADTSFQVLGPAVEVAAGSQLVIYNLGTAEADAYAGNNRRTPVSTGAALSTVTYTAAGGGFPIDSPDHRFFVVGAPVSFHCASDGRLTRYAGYGWSATQPTLASGSLAAASASRLATTVAQCSFELDAGLANLGSVLIRLTLSRDGESVTLLHQVTVDATP